MPELDLSVMRKYFAFLTINSFLTMLVAGSLLSLVSEFKHYISNPGDLVQMLATSIPPQANFFINYVMISSFTVHTMSLWRPVDVVIYWIKRKYFAKTSRERKELNKPLEYPFNVYYAQTLLIFLIVISYSTISPLILPFGLAYFMLAYLSTRYNLIYVYQQTYEGGGLLFPSVINRLCFCVALYQVTLAGVFSLNLYPIAAAVVSAMVIVTGIFWYYLKYHFLLQATYLPLNVCIAQSSIQDLHESNEILSNEKEYLHKAMEPIRKNQRNEISVTTHSDQNIETVPLLLTK